MKKSDPIFVPNFPSVEAASRYAEIYKPFEKAFENFPNRDAYRKAYGEKAFKHALACWEASCEGDIEAMIRHTRQLSISLPAHVWDYR